MYLINKIKELFGFKKQLNASRTGRVIWRRRSPINNQIKKQVINSKPTDYLINDPTTPNLHKEIAIPAPPSHPVFHVKGFQGGGFEFGSTEWQAANVQTSIANTLNWVNKHAASIKARQLPSSWAGTGNLVVIPQAGTQLNAFYNRATMQFFFFHQPDKTIYTANSSDIVTHELGHAILDTYRPDTWSAASLEVWSFHEAFADLVAMLSVMQHDEVLEFALSETGNDIKKENVFSRIAEEVGGAIYSVSGGSKSGRPSTHLRSAINDFKYVNPGSLPEQAPHNKLAAESHSFGRIFLGAFYDILIGIYEQTCQEGHSPIDALKHSRDVLSQYVIKAIQNAPSNLMFFESVAKTMLWADYSTHKKYHDLMQKVFLDRNIIRPNLKMLSAPECDNDDLIVRSQSSKVIKLSDHIVRAQSQEDNELYDAEIEIPNEQVYLYDNNKNVYDIISVTDDEALSAAQDFIVFLNNADLVSNEPDTPFELTEGKLKRTHFS